MLLLNICIYYNIITLYHLKNQLFKVIIVDISNNNAMYFFIR